MVAVIVVSVIVLSVIVVVIVGFALRRIALRRISLRRIALRRIVLRRVVLRRVSIREKYLRNTSRTDHYLHRSQYRELLLQAVLVPLQGGYGYSEYMLVSKAVLYPKEVSGDRNWSVACHDGAYLH